MILTKHEIKTQLDLGNIEIEPFNEKQLNPNSYNLKLHNKLIVYKNELLDMKRNNPISEIAIPETGLVLYPNILYLGRTVERTYCKRHIPMIEGRSSIGRLGMFVHVTAGFGDIGFNGYWTLEIQVIHKLVVYPNVEIAQIYFHNVAGLHYSEYEGKYNNNTDIQPSMLWKDFE
jgi:dCTP deaminase